MPVERCPPTRSSVHGSARSCSSWQGKTSVETAQKMHISSKTVESHRRNIIQKLGLHGTAELTKYAVREGLTSLDG